MRRLTRRLLLVAAMLAPMPLAAGEPTAHDFSFPGIDGGTIDLAAFAGQPVLVVNTASRCGYTYQYDGLQALYDAYRDRGLVVLGVPSDDFGGQELDTEAEVKEFCAVNFALDFPMTAITTVKGRDAHPFYRWAASTEGGGTPGWNFHKFLIGPDGKLAAEFPTSVEPGSSKVSAAVEALLTPRS